MAAFEEGLSSAINIFRLNPTLTRAEFVNLSGLSRTAVNQRLEALLAAELITADQGEVQTKGRPADRFCFNGTRGKVLAADIGATSARVAICNLAGEIEQEAVMGVDLSDGPEPVLNAVMQQFDSLFQQQDEINTAAIKGIGISVPAPVKMNAGFSVSPPIMPTWNRFDVPAFISTHYSAPVFLEKDSNAMAYGEYRSRYPDVANLMMVKIGTGIGSGFILDGKLFRGADGAAGDLGHTPVEILQTDDGPLCKCGNRGCLEAYAGGWAILRDLQEAGIEVHTQADLIELISAADPVVLEAVRRAGRLIGSAIASAINLTNPRVVVLGGRIASVGGDHFFAGIREMVYRRSLPLATSQLQIEQSTLYPRSGVIGLAYLVTDAVLSPARIGNLLPSSLQSSTSTSTSALI